MPTFQLSAENPDLTNNCFSLIRTDLINEKILTITISDRREIRSQAQRRLMWSWYTQIATFTGAHKDEIRNEMMKRFAIPIFYRDQIVVNGVNSADTIDTIRDLKSHGLHNFHSQLATSFVACISSNNFNVKQNTEYLDDIFKFSLDQECYLYIPRECLNAKHNAHRI